MADGPRTTQWHDLRFDLKVRPPEANACGAGNNAGQMHRHGAHDDQEEDRFDRSASTSPKKRKQPATKSRTKLAQLEAMLRRPDGATVEQISKSLAWQVHSVRGAMSGALKKKQGLTITSERSVDGRRVYRIAA